MTFPEQADIEFFKGAKRIQAVVKAGHGSWVYRPEGFQPRLQLLSEAYPMRGPGDIVIPRLDQLIEMLEERGCRITLHGCWPNCKGYEVRYVVFVEPKPGMGSHSHGPTPSIALGKCLLEVLEKEE